MGRMRGGSNTGFLDDGATGRMGRMNYKVANLAKYVAPWCFKERGEDGDDVATMNYRVSR